MNFKVVSKFVQSDFLDVSHGYLGLDREGIIFPVHFFETQNKIWVLYEKYEEMTLESCYIQDYEFAIDIQDCYNEIYPSKQNEVIELVTKEDKPTVLTNFLGYDIEDRGNSNILRILLYFFYSYENFDDSFSKCLNLVAKSLRPLLNENMLFSNNNEDELALKILDGLFEIFERKSKFYSFEIVAIYN